VPSHRVTRATTLGCERLGFVSFVKRLICFTGAASTLINDQLRNITRPQNTQLHAILRIGKPSEPDRGNSCEGKFR